VADAAAQRLKHGYTNATATDGRTVVKRFLGPDAEIRQHNEVVALTALAGVLPVPPVVSAADGELTLGLADGRPGQELLEEQPERVLHAVGRLARRLAAVDLAQVVALDAAPNGTVLVHGDFGPQNVLLDPATVEPTSLLDWEFAHIGDPVEDVAWAEWIVRTHHADLVPALSALFDGYGAEPPWPVRQESMIEKCRWLLGFTRRWPGGGNAGVELWQRRLAATEAFQP
jgi:aminoglycoside phosphotransferase